MGYSDLNSELDELFSRIAITDIRIFTTDQRKSLDLRRNLSVRQVVIINTNLNPSFSVFH